MTKYKTISEFLKNQDADKLAQINELRKIILSAEPLLTENIKWNAPNYIFNGEDCITFNLMNKEGAVKLIIHMGASKKEDKKARPILKDDSGLIEWNSNIRGTLTFTDIDDIKSKQDELTAIIKQWLALA